MTIRGRRRQVLCLSIDDGPQLLSAERNLTCLRSDRLSAVARRVLVELWPAPTDGCASSRRQNPPDRRHRPNRPRTADKKTSPCAN
ncbi:hypothetical protein [Pandoravirus japonicus]|uniref:Uncharacterized protein n=1 Tax=Pandoravirus japonicus TaxID=2823154 RepID=A0A811BMV8_9VIRU|nr:hypothetical protein [Pandoravirus japonicus]BCU03148.1 hypothetical protein [Pandoravirus japonicus]